jgi:hypothetical protein
MQPSIAITHINSLTMCIQFQVSVQDSRTSYLYVSEKPHEGSNLVRILPGASGVVSRDESSFGTRERTRVTGDDVRLAATALRLYPRTAGAREARCYGSTEPYCCQGIHGTRRRCAAAHAREAVA